MNPYLMGSLLFATFESWSLTFGIPCAFGFYIGKVEEVITKQNTTHEAKSLAGWVSWYDWYVWDEIS